MYGNLETPPLSINPTVEELTDSTFLFSSTPQNLENIIWFFPDGEIAAEEVEYTFSDTGFYEIEVCGEYCDSLFCEWVGVQVDVSVGELDLHSINVFPNPANDVIFISSDVVISNVWLCDISGKILLRKQVQSNHAEIAAGEIAIGMYFLKIETADGKLWNKKIEIE